MMNVEKQIEEITKLAYDIGAYPLAFKKELRALLSSAQSMQPKRATKACNPDQAPKEKQFVNAHPAEGAPAQAKPFMWAIQEPDGNAYMDENCVSTSRGIVEAEVDSLNLGLDADDEPYKVVPVYLAATQTAAQGVERDIEAAAKKLAELTDYPWEFMPAEGRNRMRADAAAIIAASQPNGEV